MTEIEADSPLFDILIKGKWNYTNFNSFYQMTENLHSNSAEIHF